MQEQELGISIMNTCHECMLIARDKLAGFGDGMTCLSCAQDKEGFDSVIAHSLVEEGSAQYTHQLSIISDNPSGHEWVGAETVTRTREYMKEDGTIEFEHTIRDEFLEPISLIADRVFTIDTWIPPMYTICTDCHYQCHKDLPCPNCDLLAN